jgi:hypothetical protein
MSNYTAAPWERNHIDDVKDPWRASNRKNYEAQIARFLARRDAALAANAILEPPLAPKLPKAPQRPVGEHVTVFLQEVKRGWRPFREFDRTDRQELALRCIAKNLRPKLSVFLDDAALRGQVRLLFTAPLYYIAI